MLLSFSCLLPILSVVGVTQVSAALTSNLGPVVDLGYAAFAGNTTSPTGVANGPVAFYGAVPYAQPPLGNLRWRAPKTLNEKAKATSVTDARNWGPMCIQRPAVVGVGSEDCLTVNIWKPSNAKQGDNLPVAVYIHGGGFYYGTPQGFPMYDWVAQHPTGIIAVSITYRLGLLGFLSGPAVEADGNLNAGLLDQRAALEWIQRNIGKFGGDKSNVTIFGESAGGASVVMQLTAYGGKKPVPFQRAVAQSIGFGPTRTQEQVVDTFNNATVFIGCPSSGTSTMSCLRKASLGAIVSAINLTPNGQFAPIIEGASGFLTNLPSRLIHAGKFPDVEFIGGHCANDGRTFSGGSASQFVTEDDVRRLVFSRWPGVSAATIDKAMALYPSPETPGSPYATQYDRAWTMAGEIVFACMDWLVNEKLVSRGVKDVYSYSWNAPDTVLYNANPYQGVMHTSDLYYLFDGTNIFGNAGSYFTPFNASEALLSKEAIAYWTSFASTGDPSSTKISTSPSWGFYNSTDGTRQRLIPTRGDNGSSTTSTVMGSISADEMKRCEFWMSEDVVKETRV